MSKYYLKIIQGFNANAECEPEEVGAVHLPPAGDDGGGGAGAGGGGGHRVGGQHKHAPGQNWRTCGEYLFTFEILNAD